MWSQSKTLTALCVVSIILSGSAFGIVILVVLSGEDSSRQVSYIDNSTPSKVVINAVGTDEEGNIYANWSAATDNIGVHWYHVYVNGSLETWTLTTGWLVYHNTTIMLASDVQDGALYTVQVSAVDGARNEGEKSEVISIVYEGP
jgi:hypothetical protein